MHQRVFATRRPIGSTLGFINRKRVCNRCGIDVIIGERRAKKEYEAGVNPFDFMCTDCKPMQ